LKKAKVTKNNVKNNTKTSVKKSAKRREWTKADLRDLKAHSKAKTPVNKISKATKRTAGALRAKAFQLGIGLGHQR
jgi:NADH:ubiquinone oxidoreductase subunit